MPFLNPGDLDEWVHTLTALDEVDLTHIIPGHGGVLTEDDLIFFKGYLTDLICALLFVATWMVAWSSVEVPIYGVCEEGIDVLIFFSSPSRMCPASHTPQEMKWLNSAMYVSDT